MNTRLAPKPPGARLRSRSSFQLIFEGVVSLENVSSSDSTICPEATLVWKLRIATEFLNFCLTWASASIHDDCIEDRPD